LRGFNFFFSFGTIGTLLYLKTNLYDPKYVEPKKIE
jgi:hypothetical protein